MALVEQVPGYVQPVVISLPPECTSGLAEHQIEAMQQAVFGVRKGTAIYIAGCAKAFAELKQTLQGNKKSNPRQWTQFKKAGLVPFSAKEIQSLANSWEWMKSTSLNPEDWNLIGIRTIAAVANADKKTQAKVETMLLAGEKVTLPAVQELSGEKKGPSKTKTKATAVRKETPSLDELLEHATLVTQNMNVVAARLRIIELTQLNYELEEEIKELKAQLKAAKAK